MNIDHNSRPAMAIPNHDADSTTTRVPVAVAGAAPPPKTLELHQLPPGLINLGKSCYMNSMLQTLASSQRFCAYLEERARALRNGMTRADTGEPQAQRHAGWFDWFRALQEQQKQQRQHLAAVRLSTAAGASSRDPGVSLFQEAAVVAAAALDAVGLFVAPLFRTVMSALCRAALWIQGWEPPPPQSSSSPSTSSSLIEQKRMPSALSPFAAAACAPVHAISSRRRGRDGGVATAAAAAGAATVSPVAATATAAAGALARLAEGRLLLQLDAVLRRLQPVHCSADGGSTPAAVDSSALLAALRDQLPDSNLRLGQQHDAAEALACLCDCLDTELAAWQLLYGRWTQQPLSPPEPQPLPWAPLPPLEHLVVGAAPPVEANTSALEAKTHGAGSPGANIHGVASAPGACTLAPGVRPGTCPAEGSDANLQATVEAEEGPADRRARAVEASTAAPPASASASASAGVFRGGDGPPPPSPLRGVLNTTTTCCVCGGMSVLQVEPFWSLQLPLPPPPSAGSLATAPMTRPQSSSPSRRPQCPHLAAAGAGSMWQSLLPSLDPGAAGAVAGRQGPGPPQPMQRQQQRQQRPQSAQPPQQGAPRSAHGLGASRIWVGGGGGGGGLALRDCLAIAMQPEWVDGVQCSRCSLLAALRQVRGTDTAEVAATAAAAAAATAFEQEKEPALSAQRQEEAPAAVSPGPGRRSVGLVQERDALGAGQCPIDVEVRDMDRGGPCPGHSNPSDVSSGCGVNGGVDGGDGFGAAAASSGRRCAASGGDDELAGLGHYNNNYNNKNSNDKSACVGNGLELLVSNHPTGPPAGLSAAAAAAGVASAPPTSEAVGADRPAVVALTPAAAAAGGRSPLERRLARIEALLSGRHLPDLDLDLELDELRRAMRLWLLARRRWRQHSDGRGSGCDAAAVSVQRTVTPSLVSEPEPERDLELQLPRLEAVRTRVVRRSQVARCPPVLVLQLLRTLWDPRVGASVKDCRHVAFPLMLGPEERELLGAVEAEPPPPALPPAAPPAPPEVVLTRADVGPKRPEEEVGSAEVVVATKIRSGGVLESTGRPRRYILTAVVVHYGGADSGHYLMYRRVATTKAATDTAAAMPYGAARAIVCGAGGGSNADVCRTHHMWLRVSDSSVSLADEWEVLQQAAAVLMYEQE